MVSNHYTLLGANIINSKLNFEILADSLVEMGESLRQMADVKYSLDDNIKQNFLEPLHHLQTKDLKEVMVRFFFFKFIYDPSFMYYQPFFNFCSIIAKNYKVGDLIMIVSGAGKPKVRYFNTINLFMSAHT